MIFEILLNGFNDRNLARQRHVENIRLLFGVYANRIAHPQLDAEDAHALRRCCSFLERIPVPVHSVPPRISRSPRITPCAFSNASEDRPSVRSRIFRARGSPLRISCFSVSVRVSTRSVSISSISVPSKKSPSLSGAILG